MYYEKNLKDIEIRTLIYYSTWISAISAFLSYCFAMRYHLRFHISDGMFIVVTDTVFGIMI